MAPKRFAGDAAIVTGQGLRGEGVAFGSSKTVGMKLWLGSRPNITTRYPPGNHEIPSWELTYPLKSPF